MDFDITWFKQIIAPQLINYELKYDRFNATDIPNYVDRVEIESKKLGCEIIFYSDGGCYIFLYDYLIEKEILNVMMMPDENKSKENNFKKLMDLL